MRENRTYGSEGGETGTTGLPYPYIEDRPAGTEKLYADRHWTCMGGTGIESQKPPQPDPGLMKTFVV
jgi:hypothetical protein